jgi:A/G-specific adenine glycosylase
MNRVYLGRADGGPATTAADLATVTALLPTAPERAARASAAFMELGALVCTARQPACQVCPLWRDCAWRLAGQPAPTTRRRTQGYVGTDRQARGAVLALVRATPSGVAHSVIGNAWPDPAQRERALHGLLADGLIIDIDGDHYGLPGVIATS